MIKKPFFGFVKPKLRYPVAEIKEDEPVTEISLPSRITLLYRISGESEVSYPICKGDNVVTGQRINLSGRESEYITSAATGTVSDVSEFTGYLGRIYLSVTIETEEDDKKDDEFKGHSKDITSETAARYLKNIPGDPDMESLCKSDNPPDTVVIMGADKDLLVSTNRFIVKTETDALKTGIEYLKRISKSSRIVIAVTPDMAAHVKDIGAEVKEISPVYPGALPEMIIKKVLGRTVPAGRSCKEMGVCFVNAESVVALGNAFGKGEIPVTKVLTVIDKSLKSVIVKARIGTMVNEILAVLNIHAENGDRIVMGGPMKGISVYTEEMPVLWDTDAIMVQGKDQVIATSDSPCINCGDCVRICPANVPVNMLVRLLENGLYGEAVEQYDLNSCIECGLCSYVCPARIPIYHYIMLGKYEFDKIRRAEESNA